MIRTRLARCGQILDLFPLPGDRLLVAGGLDAGTVNRLVWVEAAAGREVRREAVGRATAVAVSADGRRLAVGRMVGGERQHAGYLRVGHPDAPPADWADVPAPPGAAFGTLTAGRLAFDPAGAVWAGLCRSGWHAGKLRRIDRLVRSPADGGCPTEFFDRDHLVGLLAAGRRLAVAAGRYGPPRVDVLDPAGRVRVSAFEPPGDHATALAWSPDDRRLAVLAGRRGWLLDPDTGQIAARIGEHRRQLHAVAFAPDGRRVLTAGSDGCVRAWDVETGRLAVEWDFRVGPVTAVAVAPDGLTAAAGGNGGRLVVWDLDA